MIRLEITNLPAFQRSLEKLIKGLKEDMGAEIEAGTNRLAESARGRVPVNSGTLKDSIEVREETGMDFVILAAAPHARFVEFGTLSRPAQPFLVPAAEEIFPMVVGNLVGAINKNTKD